MSEIIQGISQISAPIFWLIVLIVSAVLEGCTAALVSIWFIGGAIVAIILSLLHVSFTIQLIAFFISSIALLILTRPIVKKWLKVGENRTNLDQVIDKKAKVTEVIDNKQSTGEVYIDGKYWTARNVDDEAEPIPTNTFVTVKAIKGVKLFVEFNKEGKK